MPARENLRKRKRATPKLTAAAQLQQGLAQNRQLRRDPYGLGGEAFRRPHCSRGQHGRKKNCAADPFCLYGLGEGKEGVWHKDPPQLRELGPDPAAQVRVADVEAALAVVEGAGQGEDGTMALEGASEAKHDEAAAPRIPLRQPAGLDNLGATCYVSALLQALFHNPIFRHAVFTYPVREAMVGAAGNDDAGREEAIMAALQRLFCAMDRSVVASCDPRELLGLLGIAPSEQQDAQEFNALFLAKLERIFTRRGMDVVARLFAGRQANRTTCDRCGGVSEREEAFDKLEMHVQGQKSVQDGLNALSVPELLEGDNQYFCERCGCKVNATRCTQLRVLPEVLNVQLLRYVYDRTTYKRKKLKDKIRLEKVLRLEAMRRTSIVEIAEYELAAVLYHRGASAYGGHYVAEVRDWASGAWWTFDDAVVKRMGHEEKEEESPEAKPGSGKRGKGGKGGKNASGGRGKGGGGGGGKKLGSGRRAVGKKQSPAPRPARDVVAVDLDDDMSDTDGTASSATWIQADPEAAAATGVSETVSTAFQDGVVTDATRADGSGDAGTADASDSCHKASADAYMLIYVKKSFLMQTQHVAPPPAGTLAAVRRGDLERLRLCRAYAVRRGGILAAMERRRAVYDAAFGNPQRPAAPWRREDGGHFVATSWLRQFVTGWHDVTCKPDAKLKVAKKPDVGGASASTSGSPSPAVHVIELDADEPEPPAEPEVAPASPTPAEPHGVFCGPMVHAPFACPHLRHVHPLRIAELKIVSPEAFVALVGEVGPPDVNLTVGNFRCDECVGGLARETSAEAEEQSRYVHLLRQLEEATSLKEPGDACASYLLSRSWAAKFQQQMQVLLRQVTKQNGSLEDAKVAPQGTLVDLWSKPSAKAVEDKVDSTVNGALQCPHGGLAAANVRCLSVSAALWRSVMEIFPDAVAFPANAQPCAACAAEEQRLTQAKLSGRERRSQELAAHRDVKTLRQRRNLVPSVFLQLETKAPSEVAGLNNSEAFFGIRGAWVRAWREYHGGPKLPPPPLLDQGSLVCSHGRVLLPLGLADVFEKPQRGEHVEVPVVEDVAGEASSMEIVSEACWRVLQQYHGARKTEPPVIVVDAEDATVAGPGSEEIRLQWIGGDWVFTPPRCRVCEAKAAEEHLTARKEFIDASLKVVSLKSSDPVPGFVAPIPEGADNGGADADDTGAKIADETEDFQPDPTTVATDALQQLGRQRARPRRRRRQQGAPLTVMASYGDSVLQLKLRLWEQLSDDAAAPNQQELYCNGRILVDNDATLAAAGIRAGDTVYLKLLEGAEDDGLWYTALTEDAQATAAETGFQGTFLQSS